MKFCTPSLSALDHAFTLLLRQFRRLPLAPSRKFLFPFPFLLSFLFSVPVSAQTSGIVTDAESSAPIIGATVVPVGETRGAITDFEGRFELAGRPDSLQVAFLGYVTTTIPVPSDGNCGTIPLSPSVVMIEQAAEVRAEANAHLAGTTLGRETLEVEAMETLPALLGEVDPLKVLQLLPGVQSAGEGNSGFYVRGGGPDQNLLLLDNAVVYNASHLLGFFSVFNADALETVDLMKGAMPAQYGGRISSVLSISQRQGDMEKWRTRGGLGLISSRVTVEGPLVNNKASLLLSGRRTYIDALLTPFLKNGSFAGTRYFFGDLNGRLDWKASEADALSLSFYHGRDVFKFNSAEAGFETEIPWGNSVGALNWSHIFSDQILITSTLSSTAYSFSFNAGQDDFRFGFDSSVRDLAGKVTLTGHSADLRHHFAAGVEAIHHNFQPTDFSASSNDVTFDTGTSERALSQEWAAFASDGWDLTDALRVEAGLRASTFRHVGPFTRYIEPAVGSPEPADSIVYSRGDVIGTHGGLEPRLAARLIVGPRTSLKAGWSRNLQYIHLVSLSATSLPADIWLPSTEKLAPQRGELVSFGAFQELGAQWECSVEGYYKTLTGLPAYRENARPEDNIGTNVDNNLVTGRGWSYGVETFAKRRYGDLTGWVGYTWSKTMRQFDDLNGGQEFPARFDRRHDLSIVLDWKVNEKWRIAGTFVYATGNSITLPVARFLLEGRITEIYGDRNGYRMAPYHRADIGATLTTERRGDWSFSIYNLYSRLNPYFIYFEADGSLNEGAFTLSARQVSLFPILPSVTWNFDF